MCLGGSVGPDATFDLLSPVCAGGSPTSWVGVGIDAFGAGMSFSHVQLVPSGFIEIVGLKAGAPIPMEDSAAGAFAIHPTIPEPSTLTLCLSALLALAFVGRKRLAKSLGPPNGTKR